MKAVIRAFTIPKRTRAAIVVLLVSISAQVSSAVAKAPSLVGLMLPGNVEIAVPSDWNYFDPQIGSAIANATKAEIDLRSIQPQDPMSSDAIIRANSPLDGGYASLSLKFFSEPTDLGAVRYALNGDDHLKEIADYQEQLARKKLSADQRFIEQVALEPITLQGDLPAFAFIYRRQGLGGPVRVEILAAFRSDGYAVLTLAYRESEASRWAPLIKSIRQSLSINARE